MAPSPCSASDRCQRVRCRDEFVESLLRRPSEPFFELAHIDVGAPSVGDEAMAARMKETLECVDPRDHVAGLDPGDRRLLHVRQLSQLSLRQLCSSPCL